MTPRGSTGDAPAAGWRWCFATPADRPRPAAREGRGLLLPLVLIAGAGHAAPACATDSRVIEVPPLQVKSRVLPRTLHTPTLVFRGLDAPAQPRRPRVIDVPPIRVRSRVLPRTLHTPTLVFTGLAGQQPAGIRIAVPALRLRGLGHPARLPRRIDVPMLQVESRVLARTLHTPTLVFRGLDAPAQPRRPRVIDVPPIGVKSRILPRTLHTPTLVFTGRALAPLGTPRRGPAGAAGAGPRFELLRVVPLDGGGINPFDPTGLRDAIESARTPTPPQPLPAPVPLPQPGEPVPGGGEGPPGEGAGPGGVVVIPGGGGPE